MTVPNTPIKNSFNCDGSTVEFDFTFPVPNSEAQDSVLVILLDTTSGAETELVADTDYTITAPNNDFSSGGTITTAQAYSDDYELHVYRQLTVEQESDLTIGGSLPATTIEALFDRVIMLLQEQADKLSRALVFSVVDSALNENLPNATDRALKNLMFDSDGEPIVGSTLSGVVASSWAQTLIDDTSAAAARQTLGCPHADDIMCYEGDVLVYEQNVLTYI